MGRPAMDPLYLRRSHASDEVIGPLTPEEVLEAAPSGDDCLSLGVGDPFVPVVRDLDRNARLREVLLRAFPLERAVRFSRIRFALFSGMVPMLLLVLLDAELFRVGHEGALAALAVDVLTVAVVAVDLARPFPRHPHITAAAFGAVGLRFMHLAATRCDAGPNSWLLSFGSLALVCCVVMLIVAPSPRAMADHVRSALAMAPPTRLPTRKSPEFFRYIFYAIAAAALLPALLWLLRFSEMSLSLQLLAFLGFALVVPYVGRVLVGRDVPAHRDSVTGALGIPLAFHRPSLRVTLRALSRATTVAIASLVLSFALVRGSQSAIEAVARTQQCFAAQDSPPPALQRLLDAQRTEAPVPGLPKAPSWLLLTVLVVPIAEELVYRGLVQHALRRRLKRRVAIGLSALLFGIAHVVVFPNAVYQTVLLGLSFGFAYERAGILASILVHVLWNLWLSI